MAERTDTWKVPECGRSYMWRAEETAAPLAIPHGIDKTKNWLERTMEPNDGIRSDTIIVQNALR